MPQEPAPGLWRLAGLGAALGAYAIASHLLMAHAPDRPWSVAALFGPLWVALALGALARSHWPALAACAAVLAGVAVVVARGGVEDIHLMYLLQHAGIHAALAGIFGFTLRPGGQALITAMAERVHGTITPAIGRYTRRLTQIWVAYFLGIIGFSLVLYAAAPWPWWSLFCNLGTPLAVLALFGGEHVWRRARHPEFGRVSLLSVVQAFRQRRAGHGVVQ